MKSTCMQSGWWIAMVIALVLTGAATGAAAGGFDFNNGTLQGWIYEGPTDEVRHGPFASNFSVGWADAVNYPAATLSETMGNNLGSYMISNTGGHGITNPEGQLWIIQLKSPDFSADPVWQNAGGFSIKLLNAMDLIGTADAHLDLYVNLILEIYDQDQAKVRGYRAFEENQRIATWNENPNWTNLSFDWTTVLSSIPRYTIRHVYIYLEGSMADYFEGGFYFDEIQPAASGTAGPRDNWIHADIETKLTPGDGAEGDLFGVSVDVDGDYMIAGAFRDGNAGGMLAGAAYVYHWDGNNWIEQQKLMAPDGAAEFYFGYSVGISGDYVIVGSCWADDATDMSGAAYIFKRSGATWTQEARLNADDAGPDNGFGISVAIDGEYAIVGAALVDDFGTRSGSAYIFKRSGSSWARQARLLASDGAAEDQFGLSVNLDGTRAAVGASNHKKGDTPLAGAVYLFRRDGTAWSEEQKITPGDAQTLDHYHICSLQGDWLAVGRDYMSNNYAYDAGAVYMFHREGSAWVERQKLTPDEGALGDRFGAHSRLNEDCLVVGAYRDDDNGTDSGSIYVFRLDGDQWRQETKIIASDGAGSDWYGLSVGITGEWIVAGARLHDQNGFNSGAVYLYRYGEKYKWMRPDIEIKLKAGETTEGDAYGGFIDKDGPWYIVGAHLDDNSGGNDAGAAYLYRWNGTKWIEFKKLVAADGAAEDYFGYGVGISGDYAIVGACWDDDAADKSGSAYIFRWTGSDWVQEAKLTADDGGTDNRFGISVAIDGNYAMVGAFFDEDLGTRSGSAYIFKRDGSTWIQQAKLLASDGAAQDWFGVSTALDDDYAVVGSRYHDNGAISDAGAVYVFKRSGTAWFEQQKLVAGDGAAADLFHQCSIAGSWLAVGAYQHDAKAKNAGAVYLFQRNGEVWSERQKIVADDGAEGDFFGAHTSLYEEGLAVGAYLDDDNGKDSGSLYIFRYDGSQWRQETKIIASDGEEADWYGLPVVYDEEWIISGARQDDDKGANAGAIYIYKYLNPATPVEENGPGLPVSCKLEQNYPNPFNPRTTIRYRLADPAAALITIYDSRGRTVAVLNQGEQGAGEHTVVWQGVDSTDRPVASGVYFYRLAVQAALRDTPHYLELKKMILLR